MALGELLPSTIFDLHNTVNTSIYHVKEMLLTAGLYACAR